MLAPLNRSMFSPIMLTQGSVSLLFFGLNLFVNHFIGNEGRDTTGDGIPIIMARLY
jgi:hypothetical protein